MGLSLSLTEDDALIAFRALLVEALPAGWEVILAQDNRVPEPGTPTFVVMTPLRRTRLSTNVDTWDYADTNPAAIDLKHDVQVDIQLDIHGPGGADVGTIIGTIMRDDWAVERLKPANVAPLFATDGRQLAFLNAEQQYENRWTLEAALQIAPSVSTAAQFAATLETTINPPIGGPTP